MAKWKPKEKEVALEDALNLAIRELKPFWFGSHPLIAGIPSEGKVLAYPLDPKFAEKTWVIYFVDPTSAMRKEVLLFAREYHRRFNANDLDMLMVLSAPYSYLLERTPVEVLIGRNGIPFPLVVDSDGAIAQSFNVKEWPKVILMKEGEIHLEKSGMDWINDFEEKLHAFLRESDPGLPLQEFYSPSWTRKKDVLAVEFGAKKAAKYPPEGFNLVGQWKREKERIITDDASAELHFSTPATDVSMIAQSALIEKKIPTKVLLSVDGFMPKKQNEGSDLQGEEPNVHLSLEHPRMYHLLQGLAPGAQIVLKFPEARRTPVALYGLRFSDPV